ncbi:MAG: hypothetical protein RL375_4002 [Pseudomonadota bacterium]
MNTRWHHTCLAAAIAALLVPVAAQAAEADLIKRIDTLTKELEQLKTQVQADQQKSGKAAEELKEQVKAVEDKSLSRWLTVGGDYQFRVDSMRGETRTFTDVNATFGKAAQVMQAAFFADPTNPANSGALSALMGFSGQMSTVKTFDEAQAFLGANSAMLGGLGSFAVTVPAYKPRNDLIYSNRLGLDLSAKAAQDVTVNARFVMYKVFGEQDAGALTNGSSAPFFADRVGVFDGTLGRVPSSSLLNVDRAYATWSNIGGEDLWFSVGRRPSTQGAPTNFKLNQAKPGTGGTPALLVDYAFDGMTVGYAPDIDALPGSYLKFCYGRGFESGFRSTPGNSLQDTDMAGLAVVPLDTDPLRVWLQWNRGMNIFDAPAMRNTYFGDTSAKANLGDIDWWGLGAMGTIKNAGPGALNWFADVGVSITHPNNNVSAQFGFQGLMTGGFFAPEAPTSKTGTGLWMGLRYDLPSGTKLGLEYNHGSKNWITFAPAAGDMWTSKAGTRGHVYDAYLIQDLSNKPVSSAQAKTFLRLGMQVYDFQYTGSNNWVGAPMKISEVNGQMMTMTPLSKAVNVYATAEVKF